MPRISLTLSCSALLFCAFLSPAFATPTLTVSDGAGNTANGTNNNGNLSFNGTIGEWTVNLSTTAPAGGGSSNVVAVNFNSSSLFQPGNSPPPNGNKLTITFIADGLPSVNGPATAVATVDGAQKNGSVVFTTLTNGIQLTSSGGTNLTGIISPVELSNTVAVAGFSGAMTIQAVIVANAAELVALAGNLSVSNKVSQTNALLKFLPGGILSSNGFKLTLQGMTVGSNYLVQGSTDTVTWLPLTNFKSLSISTNLMDTNATKLARRLYRAKAQ